MSKTTLTKQMEEAIFNATNKMGVFGCFEVSIGFNANCKERVDYMTYDTKGIFRCYELKITKADFHSKNHNTFCGNYNYYVMPEELVNEVIGEIPVDIGIFTYRPFPTEGGYVQCSRRAGKKVLSHEDAESLKDYMIRSLSREGEKVFKSESVAHHKQLKERLQKAEENAKANRDEVLALRKQLGEIYGKTYNLLDWLARMNHAGAIRWEGAPNGVQMLQGFSKTTQRQRKYGMCTDEEYDTFNEMYERIFGVKVDEDWLPIAGQGREGES